MKKLRNHIDKFLPTGKLEYRIRHFSKETQLNNDLLDFMKQTYIPHDLVIDVGSYLLMEPLSFLSSKYLVKNFFQMYQNSSCGYIAAKLSMEKHSVYNFVTKVASNQKHVLSAGWGLTLSNLLSNEEIDSLVAVYNKFDSDVSIFLTQNNWR